MWIDTHCHLDAHEFGAQAPGIAARAQAEGVVMIVIPAVDRHNFAAVRAMAHALPGTCYALGIHPICVPHAADDDLRLLREAVERALPDPRFVAIGEIGLDFFIPALTEPAMRERQERFFRAQLRLAREFALPVLMHVRRSQDMILKHERQVRPAGGIAHAFNGSFQQATAFIDLGFKLGFGGAMTFSRALQIRRLATDLPLDAIVLETDAPDIAPVWLHPGRNSPEQLPAIGAALAQLRGSDPAAIARETGRTALAALPRLSQLVGLP
jgi:TatD DNase family protein